MVQDSIYSEFTFEQVISLTNRNPSLRGMMQGYLAEESLKKQLLQLPSVSSVTKIPDHAKRKGDFEVIYNDRIVTVEVKSIDTSSITRDVLNDTWQGRVGIGNTDLRDLDIPGVGKVRTSSLLKGGFDILAVCSYAVNKKWEFLFIENKYLPEKSLDTPGLLKTSFVVNPETTPLVYSSFDRVMSESLKV